MSNFKKPPGTALPTENVSFYPNTGSVAFESVPKTSPFSNFLMPIVRSYYTPDNPQLPEGPGTLNAYCVIFICNEVTQPTTVGVYTFMYGVLPCFYIDYDEAETVSNNFTSHSVNFNIHLKSKPQTICTGLWDEDPKYSRGTETTVQPA